MRSSGRSIWVHVNLTIHTFYKEQTVRIYTSLVNWTLISRFLCLKKHLVLVETTNPI